MSKQLAFSIALTARVVFTGFSGCRTGQQSYAPRTIGQPNFSAGQIFPPAGEIGKRFGSIAVNRGINAAITGIINNL